MRTISKVGIAVISDRRILLVRKKGGQHLILPGGKPELGEDDLMALEREIEEELGCLIERQSLLFCGCFTDRAAGLFDTMVVVQLYRGELCGKPTPCAEIEAIDWFPIDDHENPLLAPSLRNSILPSLARLAKPPSDEVFEGGLERLH